MVPEFLPTEVRNAVSLDEILRFALRQEPPWTPVDAVVQDEFTHDVVFRMEDGRFLVLDAT